MVVSRHVQAGNQFAVNAYNTLFGNPLAVNCPPAVGYGEETTDNNMVEDTSNDAPILLNECDEDDDDEVSIIEAEYTHHGYSRSYERSITDSKIVDTLSNGIKVPKDDPKYPNTHKVVGDDVVVVEPIDTPNVVVTTYWKVDRYERFGVPPPQPKFVVLEGETPSQAMKRLQKEVKNVQVYETGKAVYHLQKKHERKLEQMQHEGEDQMQRRIEEVQQEGEDKMKRRVKELQKTNEKLQWELDCEKHQSDFTKRQLETSDSLISKWVHNHDEEEECRTKKRQRLA